MVSNLLFDLPATDDGILERWQSRFNETAQKR